MGWKGVYVVWNAQRRKATGPATDLQGRPPPRLLVTEVDSLYSTRLSQLLSAWGAGRVSNFSARPHRYFVYNLNHHHVLLLRTVLCFLLLLELELPSISQHIPSSSFTLIYDTYNSKLSPISLVE